MQKKWHKSWFLKASLVRKRTASLKSLLQSNTSAFGGPLQRGAFCQFPFRWIYYCGSNESTGKETGKTHLCAVGLMLHPLKSDDKYAQNSVQLVRGLSFRSDFLQNPYFRHTVFRKFPRKK